MINQNKHNFSLARLVAQRRPRCPSSPRRSPAARPCRRGCGSFGKNYIYLGFLLIVFYYLLLATANAQFELPTIGSIKPTISLNSDPTTPLPNSTIAVTANLSGITGAGDSNYTWFLNGARQTSVSGLNKNTLTFKIGAIGSVYAVGVSVTTPGGENLSDVIYLTASDADLTWFANSKTPVFYRAKPMPTQNSLITISAMPFIYRPGTKTLISSSNLIYNWMPGDKIDSLKSGLNKSSYIFRAGDFPGSSYFIRLEVKTADGAVSLSKDVAIPVVRPNVLLYFSDPETDLPYGTALNNLTTKLTYFNFIAQTYFFTVTENDLKWQWFVNNTEASGGSEKPWLATLNLKNYFSGALSAQVKVTAQNPNNELEVADSVINLEVK